MIEWLCIQVVNHKRVAKAIQEQQEKGWILYSYQVAPYNEGVYHYLLFEKDSEYIFAED